jgi:hypothetical protein
MVSNSVWCGVAISFSAGGTQQILARLPSCSTAMRRVAAILRSGVRFGLVEGLPIDALSLEEAKAKSRILSSLIARPSRRISMAP